MRKMNYNNIQRYKRSLKFYFLAAALAFWRAACILGSFKSKLGSCFGTSSAFLRGPGLRLRDKCCSALSLDAAGGGAGAGVGLRTRRSALACGFATRLGAYSCGSVIIR
jgi:hypothetical protein